MAGLNPRYRKYIRPVIGIIIMIAGIVFMLIPFIPIGYILILVGAFFLAPEVPAVGRMIDKLKKKDKKNRIAKAEKKFNEVEEEIDEAIIDEDKE